jgi:iron(III) transport system substrate-binding protein
VTRVSTIKLPRSLIRASIVSMSLLLLAACAKEPQPTVVVYANVDRSIAEPILKEFERQSGIVVRAMYDTEANKTTGLVSRLLAERASPRADVYWSGEVSQTIALAKEGVLARYYLRDPEERPARFRSKDNLWHGFAPRARVALVHTTLVAPADEPLNVEELIHPRWRGKVGIANPEFGTTGSHLAALLEGWGPERFSSWLAAMRANEVRILPGNAQVKDAVAAGQLAVGLTDSDDAVEAIKQGAPVKMLLIAQSNDVPVMLIPSTVARVQGGPNAGNDLALLDYLLSAGVEQALIEREGVFYPSRQGVGTLGDRDLVATSAPASFESLGEARKAMLTLIEQAWFAQQPTPRSMLFGQR